MPTNVYGPGDNYHPTQGAGTSVSCWGTGTPLREFLYVDDLGEACVFALEHWDPAASTVPRMEDCALLTWLNVGSGVDLTVRKLAEQLAAATGYLSTITWATSKPDDTPKKQLDMNGLAGPHPPRRGLGQHGGRHIPGEENQNLAVLSQQVGQLTRRCEAASG